MSLSTDTHYWKACHLALTHSTDTHTCGHCTTPPLTRFFLTFFLTFFHFLPHFLRYPRRFYRPGGGPTAQSETKRNRRGFNIQLTSNEFLTKYNMSLKLIFPQTFPTSFLINTVGSFCQCRVQFINSNVWRVKSAKIPLCSRSPSVTLSLMPPSSHRRV